MHSALKYQGQRLYELARRGESVERPARRIVIHHIERRGLDNHRLEFEVRCSKGTYIRSLAADIAARLGTLGYLAGLRRLSVDPFDAYPMQTLETLAGMREQGTAALDGLLLGADVAFADLASVHLNAAATQMLLLGQAVAAGIGTGQGGASLRAYGEGGCFLGLVEGREDGQVQPVRLFVNVAGTDTPDIP
jgi:tRNA pseudouridine55 synthase